MDKKQAQSLIKETFESSFDKGRFIGFAKNLLNDVEEATFIYKGNYIPDAYKQYINTLERIGKYTDGEHKIDILIAKLKKETSIERARTMQRNFIAWYLNGGRGGELKDAALVAFVAPNDEDWRFSLVKMDYRFEEGKKGRMRVKEEFTPARRWSFLVGVNENSHTAQSQLVDLVADDERNPVLAQLEEAFNIEKVTREFFEKYRELFLWTKETLDETVKKDRKIREDFEAKGVDTVDFSKKLLGQIVFLYFLQKKGWFGVKRDAAWGTGPKNFLRELFEGKHGSYKNFFNDILEPLFYEALARERDDDFYSRFNCKIPFLNGGLFDPINNYDWVHTDILLPDDLFSNGYKTKEGDKGNGILDIFDRYNFTVKEDEPLEKEVAVDPEMLGKVFENLLEVKDRKSKGTYYTPREIVHYMCRQSLINYLATELEGKVSKEDIETLIKYGEHLGENEATMEAKGRETSTYFYKLPESIRQNAELIDEKLATIKVCDPAIGSGAFPIGMMTEIVLTRSTLSSYVKDPKWTLYNFKWNCIHNSLYGVDIDPSAVEIAKLRLWLSLVVDEDDIRQIKPLPNLDYKIMQGNSLLEEYEGVRLFDDKLISTVNFDKEKQASALKEKQAELSSEYIRLHQADKLTRDKRQQIDEKLKKISTQIKRFEQSGKKVEENASLFDIYSIAKKKSDELKRLHKEFFETTQKTKKDELKKQIERLEWDLIEATLKEQGKKTQLGDIEKLRKANTKPFFLWKLHFSDVFQEKGGFDVVIANPPYIDSESMARTGQGDVREAIQKTYEMTKGNWDIYIAFFELGFKRMNKSGTLTFITPDKWISKPFGNELRKRTVNNIFAILKAGREIFDAAKVDSIVSFFSNRDNSHIKILDFEDGQFVSKREIDKKSLIPPFTFDHLFSENLNFLCKIENFSSRILDLAECENACATSDAYKIEALIKELPENKFCPTKHFKIINTGTIGKFCMKWGNREMTYLKKKYQCPILDRKRFLDSFKNSYGRKSTQPKIILKGLNLLDACLDETGTVVPGKTTLIIADNDIQKLKLLLAVLNSRLPIFYIKERYPASSYNQGTTFTTDMINNLPLPQIDEGTKRQLIDIVNKILSITESADYLTNPLKQSKVAEYEQQIDQKVYDLYGLTEEEIKIVGGKNEQ